MVLAVSIVAAEQGFYTAEYPFELIALLILFSVPAYSLSTAFRVLAQKRPEAVEHPVALPLGYVLLGLGLLGLFTRLSLNPGSPTLLPIQLAAIVLLVSGTFLVWRLRQH